MKNLTSLKSLIAICASLALLLLAGVLSGCGECGEGMTRDPGTRACEFDPVEEEEPSVPVNIIGPERRM
ncbi:MAG: hypothetical protein ACR2PJ_03590 [Pseudomonadales bacterium]